MFTSWPSITLYKLLLKQPVILMGACFQLPSPLTARDALQESATLHQAGPAGEIQMQTMRTAKFLLFAMTGSRASFQSKHIYLKRSPLTILEGFLFAMCADQQRDSSPASAVIGVYLLPDIYLVFPASGGTNFQAYGSNVCTTFQ